MMYKNGGVDQVRVDQVGVDQVGVDQVGGGSGGGGASSLKCAYIGLMLLLQEN